MDARNQPRPQPAERSRADRAARRLARAVAGGDPAGAQAALAALGRTLEGARHDRVASAAVQENGAPRDSLDPARGIRPSRNPAFAARGAALARRRHGSRRRGGWFWSCAVVGIAIAGALAWWFAAYGPQHHGLAPSADTAGASAPPGALPANQAPRVQAAEAEILESQVMALAARMSEPVEQATLVPSEAPAVAERAAPPQAAVGTATAPDFSALGSLIAQWRNEQVQLMTAERELAAGRTGEARPLIEAVQAQIALRPVTPDDPRPTPGNNATAVLLSRTLQLMDAGKEELSRRALHRAIEELGSAFPAAGAPGARAG
ncbi:MAG: hypothetical protein ACREFN_03315 [Acetobacteraceae bacterium]